MENTNQFETDENLFEETNLTEAPKTQAEPFLSIRYDQNDVPLTREEAIEYAQKGMNYGRLEEKLNNANSAFNDLHSKLEKNAQYMGLGYDDYLSRLDELSLAYQAQQELKNLQAQYPDANPELLQKLANATAQSNIGQMSKARQDEIKSKETAEQERLGRMIDNFLEIYPGVDVGNLDPRVYELMDNKGYTLLEAYSSYLRDMSKSKEEKQKLEKLNDQNKERTYGDMTTQDDIDFDEFLQGFGK